jgi:hypothetical protein
MNTEFTKLVVDYYKGYPFVVTDVELTEVEKEKVCLVSFNDGAGNFSFGIKYEDEADLRKKFTKKVN